MELTKTLVYRGIKSEKVENIFKDPLKASKKQNILFSKNVLFKQKKMNVSESYDYYINLVIYCWSRIASWR